MSEKIKPQKDIGLVENVDNRAVVYGYFTVDAEYRPLIISPDQPGHADSPQQSEQTIRSWDGKQ